MVIESISANGRGDSKALEGIWNKGILCRIQGGIWSMEARLDPGDLNMRGEELPDFVKLGSKKLLPDREKQRFLNTLGRARTVADRLGFPFFIGGSYFIPFENFEQLKENIDKERAKFFGYVDEFIDRYEALREEYLESYARHASSLATHYPDVDYVRSKFKFETIYYAANIGSVVGDQGSAEDMYLSWAVSSMNALRTEARQVADAVTTAIENGTLDGRSMRPVQKLVDSVSSKDLLENEEFRGATMALAGSPSKYTASQLKKVANDVDEMYVRRVLID